DPAPVQTPAPVTGKTITGTTGNDALQGTAGNDSIAGYGGNDTILGGAGDDTINGGGGEDLLDGGEGNDTYLVWNINDGADTYRDTGKMGWDKILATAAGTRIGLASGFSAASSGIEEISGGGYASVNIAGTSG